MLKSSQVPKGQSRHSKSPMPRSQTFKHVSFCCCCCMLCFLVLFFWGGGGSDLSDYFSITSKQLRSYHSLGYQESKVQAFVKKPPHSELTANESNR